MKVEPSGVVFVGSCDIQSERCLAKTSGSVSAIWTPPGRTQVNVCHACLDEQIRQAKWEIAGARIKQRADLAVYDRHGQLKLVVESQNISYPLGANGTSSSQERAIQIRRNLLRHAGIPHSPFFLLAFPNSFYLWSKTKSDVLERAADYQDDSTKILGLLHDIAPSNATLDMQLASWLKGVANSDSAAAVPKWLVTSGLYDAIKGGTVVYDATL